MILVNKTVWLTVDGGTLVEIIDNLNDWKEIIPDNARLKDMKSWSTVVETDDKEIEEIWDIRLKFEWEDFE